MLEEAGRRLDCGAQGQHPNVICEHRVTKPSCDAGRDFEHAPQGFVDYLLLNTDQRPVVVEAKRESIDPLTGQVPLIGNRIGLVVNGFTARKAFRKAHIGNKVRTVYRSAEASGWPPVPGLWGSLPTALWDPPYTLTVKGGIGSGTYTNGQQVTITANTPERGYRLKHWLVDGEAIGEGQSSLTVDVTGNMTVAAVFEPIWLVFEGQSQGQRLDETGGKRGEPALLKEALSTLLVVNRDRPSETNAVLISWGRSGVQTQAVVSVSLADSYPVSSRTDKAGLLSAERNLWALSLRDNVARSLLIGTFDGAYRYDKDGVLTRVQQRVSLNGAGISPEDPCAGTALLRLNQTAGDALIRTDGGFQAMAAALRTQIKKLPSGVTAEALQGLLQHVAGE